MELTELWNTLSYWEGFIFSAWLVLGYWIKKMLDHHYR